MAVDFSSLATGAFAALGSIAALAGIPALVAKLISENLLEKRKAALLAILESHKAQLAQDTERLKAELQSVGDTARLQLKKQELIFNNEANAASAFIKLRQEISLTKTDPEQEYDDALREAVLSLHATEEKLKSYLVSHGAFIPESIYVRMKALLSTAATFKFENYQVTNGDADVSEQAKQEVDTLIGSLEPMESDILASVRAWERVPRGVA